MKSESLMRTYLEEVVALGRLELIEELANADIVDEANQIFGGPPGIKGLVAHAKGFRRNISDLEISIERIVGSEHSVMAWWGFTGLHIGPWLNRPPTNNPISASVFSFFDLVDNRIARYRLFLHAEFPESVIFDTSRADPLATL